MTADSILPFINHVWQSTLFVIAVWVIVLTLGKNRAAVRHRLWLAASVKFLFPFSLLVGIGSHFRQETSVTPPSGVSMIVETISQPFPASGPSIFLSGAISASLLPAILLSVWICGIAASLGWWFIRWRQVRRAVRLAAPSNLEGSLQVMYGPERFEPGVFGIFRPVLLLPKGIADRLSPAQFQAVVAHELCHVRRRDNLAMAIHMIVEALFWFHPLVWLIKVRLLEEQERACDEEVLQRGGDPRVYAESILKICEFYLAPPLICVSGITGSNLKKRIEDIMRNRVAMKLSLSRALLLAVATIAALAGPILFGIANVKAGGVQSEERRVAPQVARLMESAAPQRGGGAGASSLNQEYRLGDIRVIGAKFLHPDFVRSSLGLVSGEVFNESRLGQGFKELTKLYGALGHVEFLPEPVLDLDEQRKVVNLTININEGRQFSVNRITFTGNTTTPDDVLRREIPVKEGFVFNASALDSSLLRLNQLGFFEEIRIEDFLVSLSPSEPKVDIALRVKEKAR